MKDGKGIGAGFAVVGEGRQGDWWSMVVNWMTAERW